MHRIDNPWIATAKPPAQPVGTPGYFQPGNSSAQLDATVLDYDWANTVQEEIVGVVVDAGLTPDKQNDNQLALAIHQIARTEIANAAPPPSSSIVQPPLGGYANGQLVPYGGGQFQMYLSSATFTVPQGVNSIRCRVVGAGGSGSSGAAGGGGGGGEYAHGNFTVTQGAQYAVTVGTGTTSVGTLISALPGGTSTTATGGAGGTGGTGGTVRFAGGKGGNGPSNAGGGGAAGSVLGVGGDGGNSGAAGNLYGSGGAVGGKRGADGIVGTAVGGASPFRAAYIATDAYPGQGAPDATGRRAPLTTSSVSGAGTRTVGTIRYAGESLTGGGGGGGATSTDYGGDGGDGAGGGSGTTGAGGHGGNGGIFGGGGSGGGGGPAGTLGSNGGLGGGGGGSAGIGGTGWCVIEW